MFNFFVLKTDHKEKIYVDDMLKLIRMCVSQDETINNLRLTYAIYLHLRAKGFECELKSVNVGGRELVSSRDTCIKGFRPNLSIRDIIDFLIEHKYIEKVNNFPEVSTYKIL